MSLSSSRSGSKPSPSASGHPFPVQEKYTKFLDWAFKNGAYLHPSAEFVTAPDGHGANLAVRADAQPIKAHDVLLRMPYGITLSYINAVSAGEGIQDSPYNPRCSEGGKLPGEFLEGTADHETVSAVFLVQQYLLGAKSFWFPYINILPQPDDPDNIAIPFLWADKDLCWLKRTYVEESVRAQRKDYETRWERGVCDLREAGFDTAKYTTKLGLWAYYIYISRYFCGIILEPDQQKIRPEFQPLVRSGVSLDDTCKALCPVLDSFNHDAHVELSWDIGKNGLSIALTTDLEPGAPIFITYDYEPHVFNNSMLLREFGFVLSEPKYSELILRPPPQFDMTRAQHASHQIFSTAATTDQYWASSEDEYRMMLAVRSPSKDPRGPVCEKLCVRGKWVRHPLADHPILKHFHPMLVSKASFHVASLRERDLWRKDPESLPSERNTDAVVLFLQEQVRDMLDGVLKGDETLGEPSNERQRRAKVLRDEQRQILEEIVAIFRKDA